MNKEEKGKYHGIPKAFKISTLKTSCTTVEELFTATFLYFGKFVAEGEDEEEEGEVGRGEGIWGGRGTVRPGGGGGTGSAGGGGIGGGIDEVAL